MTKILIAVDDTDHSIRAASTARTIFGEDATYLVISVVDSTPVMWGGDAAMNWGVAYPAMVPAVALNRSYPLVVDSGAAPTNDAGSRPVEHAEQIAGNVAAAADIPSATPLGDTGDPADAILDAANAHDVDVIVVGSSDTGWLGRLFARPVSDGVLRDAERPVLVVP